MPTTTNSSLFIPDKPVGKDCFEGHLQERLVHSVCDYVRRIDTKPEMMSRQRTRCLGLSACEDGWETRNGI